MTPEDLSRIFRARRAGRGKWQAKCPAHEDRSPSLSITAIKDGTRIVCFAGCAQRDILNAVGLDWRALKPDGYSDPKAMAIALRERAKEEAKAKSLKKSVGICIEKMKHFETLASFYLSWLAGMSENDPRAQQFAALWHLELGRARFWCERAKTLGWNSELEVYCNWHCETGTSQSWYQAGLNDVSQAQKLAYDDWIRSLTE